MKEMFPSLNLGLFLDHSLRLFLSLLLLLELEHSTLSRPFHFFRGSFAAKTKLSVQVQVALCHESGLNDGGRSTRTDDKA